jgi:hypothetical protein
MKQNLQQQTEVLPYNKVVKEAYFKLLKDTKRLLATVDRHELRCILIRDDVQPLGFGTTQHEIISPLLYLSLESHDGERYSIQFGFEMFKGVNDEYSHVTSKFIRMLYTYTAKEHTAINIEDCINTEFVFVDCSALYETVEDRMRNHSITVIPYKPATTKRKAMMVVA